MPLVDPRLLSLFGGSKPIAPGGPSIFGGAPGNSSNGLFGAPTKTGSTKPVILPKNVARLNQLTSDAKNLSILVKLTGGNSKSLDELNKANEEIVKLGGEPVIPGHQHKGIFDRFTDVISRPGYAVENALTEMGTTATAHTKGNKPTAGGFWAGLKMLPGGALRGIEGKKKTTGAGLLQRAADVDKAHREGKTTQQQLDTPYGYAHVNPLLKGVGGLGLDLGLDPLSYTGAGLATKIPKETALHSADSAALVRRITQGTKISESDIQKLTGASSIGKNAAGQSFDLKQIAPILAKLPKTTHLPVMDNFLKTARLPVDKQMALNIGLGAKKAQVVLPGSQHFLKGAAAPFKLSPLEKVIHGFRDKMQVSYGINPEIHSAGSAVHGHASGYVQTYAKQLDKTLGKLKSAQRKSVFNDILHGMPPGQHAMPEAAQLIHDKLQNLHLGITGSLDPALAVSHTELNKYLPKHMQFEKPMVPKRTPLGKPVYNRAGAIVKERDPNWFMNSIKNKMKDTDPGHLLLQLETAHMKALSIRAFKKELVDKFGIDAAAKASGHLTSKEGWRTTKHIGDSHIFHPEVAHGADRMLQHLTDFGQIGQFGRTVQRLTNPIKTMLTKYSPGFHERNFMTDLILAGVHGTRPADMKAAFSIMAHRGHNFESGKNPLLMIPGNPVDTARMHFAGVGKGGFKNTNRLVSSDGKVHPYIHPSELYAGGHKNGIFQTHTAVELSHPILKENPVLKPFHKFSTGVSNLSDTREGIMRMARFRKEMRTAKPGTTVEEAMAKAGAEVRKWHVDYSDLTKFERNVMRNIFPFYAWTRKNIPLLAEVMMTKPGAVALTSKLQRAMSEASGYDTENSMYPNGTDSIVPQWMRDSGLVPVGPHDNSGNWHAGIPNPFTDIINQTIAPLGEGPSGVKQVVGGSVNPLFKIPYELATGKQLYSGIPTHTKNNPLWQYLVSQVPQGRVAVQTSKGNKGSLAGFLTGLYAQQNTPKRQEGEIIQSLIKAQAEKKKLRKKHHIIGRTSSGWSNSSSWGK